MRLPRTPGTLLGAVLAAGLAGALGGCAPQPAPSADSGLIDVVASTSVYGDIARAVGGDAVSVTSLISDSAQDPHSFEASAQAQLALSKAEVVIENGGGYDDFVDTLLSGSPNTAATVVNAVEFSGLDHPGLDQSGDNFNEHVWYSFPAMTNLATRLAEVFSAADPGHRAEFTAGRDAFAKGLTALEGETAALKADHAGEGVAVTEPVPLYLLSATGLTNRTPPQFSRAVEEGTGVSPAVMHATLGLLEDERVKLLVYNEQTSGPETEQLIAAAKTAGIPSVPVTETLPQDKSYLEWMGDNLAALKAALAGG